MRRIRFALFSVVILGLPSAACSSDEVIDIVIYRDPEVPTARRVQVFQLGLAQLWAEAMAHPDADQADAR